MTAGLHTVNLANKWLDMLGATAFTAPTNTYVKLHTGDPGSAATANVSANTTPRDPRLVQCRVRLEGHHGDVAASWATWAAGSETISHISVWDNLTVGSVLFTAALTASKPMTNGDTLNLTALTFSLTPLAA